MNILILAPNPFFQERGTPIAVRSLLNVLSERGDRIDVLTYHEGLPVAIPGVRIIRIPNLPFVRNILPGFSAKKVICDFFMLIKLIQLSWKNQYDVIHAVEESVFMASLMRRFTRIPYIYDMDSSLPDQLTEQMPVLIRIKRCLSLFEGIAVRGSEMVVPVCDSLAEIARKHGGRRVLVLPDISLLNDSDSENPILLKERLGIRGLVFMYVGNLQPYQGIDLLIESFAMAYPQNAAVGLVVIGGSSEHIEKYRVKCGRLHLEGCVHFMGPKPLSDLGCYLAEADVLVSPRIKGTNTPMKIYSYLHSGKPVLATILPTHTQVLNREVAVLAAPNPADFSKGMLELIQNEELRRRLGEEGKKLVEKEYSFSSFRSRVRRAYEIVEAGLGQKVRDLK